LPAGDIFQGRAFSALKSSRVDPLSDRPRAEHRQSVTVLYFGFDWTRCPPAWGLIYRTAGARATAVHASTAPSAGTRPRAAERARTISASRQEFAEQREGGVRSDAGGPGPQRHPEQKSHANLDSEGKEPDCTWTLTPNVMHLSAPWKVNSKGPLSRDAFVRLHGGT